MNYREPEKSVILYGMLHLVHLLYIYISQSQNTKSCIAMLLSLFCM